MRLSLNLLAFVVFLTLVTAIVENNQSTVYFPQDEGGFQVYNYQNGVQQITQITRQDLQYENAVDNIIANGIIKLTININNLLKSNSRESENVIFSPLSIAGVSALVLMGSNGITFKQLSTFMGLQTGIPNIDQKTQIIHEQFGRMLKKLNATSGFEFGQHINVASAVFVQAGYPIRPIYRSNAENLYDSYILNVDFQRNPQGAQTQINNWVSERTNKKINFILSDTPSDATKVILASALYFSAEWEHHFFEGSTRRRPFYTDGLNSKATIETDMMANGGEFPYYKDNDLGCEVLGLPYKGNKSTMYIIKPFHSSKTTLRAFESRITEAHLHNWVNKAETTGVVVLFPKMKIESTIDLQDTLKLLGVPSLFNPKEANLALLSPGEIATRTQITNASDNENIVPGTGLTDTTGVKTTIAFNKTNVQSRSLTPKTIDDVRRDINQLSTGNNYDNPGLYADQVIHKVYIDITEKGTEAAAASAVSLTKDGSRVTFRVDVPFSFFIRHDETNTILFWGSVTVPNPHYQIF